MTFEQLISLIKPAEVTGPRPDDIGGLTQDSRQVTEGAVFIAVEGLQADGHEFIDEAISNGAAVVISEKPYDSDVACVLRVDDTKTLLSPLAQAFKGFPGEDLFLIGITGTNGKTTVATLVYQALQELGRKPSLLGTVEKRIAGKVYDSRLTTADPVELAADMSEMIKAGSDYLVMEVSSHALDQHRTKSLNFDVAAFTNLSHDHLDYHEDFESYAVSKKKLFDGLQKDAFAVVNGDDEQADYIISDCSGKIIRFGFKDGSELPCKILSDDESGLFIKIGDEHYIESPLFGEFNAYNLVQAFLICDALGFSRGEISEALHTATGAEGRLEPVSGSGEGNPVVLVDYAHTPKALENVLHTLKNLAKDEWKLHVVFGCGGNRDKAKRPEMARIAEQYADRVTVTSDNPRFEDPDVIINEIMEGFEAPDKVWRVTDRREAIQHTLANVTSDTFVLIAGKGHEKYQEVEGERHPFDDREIASKVLADRRVNYKSNGVG